MPSPFPGMDPYLEATKYWRDVHASLIVYIRDALQPMLLPTYHARAEERVYLNSVAHDIIPDILITARQSDFKQYGFTPTVDFALDEPIVLESVYTDRPERYLEIVDTASGELVTVIEVLSPSNKYGVGKERYQEKIRELRQTETNIIEIDLLGHSRRLFQNGETSIRLNHRYEVRVHRYDMSSRQEFYPVALNQRLPRFRVPLLPTDPDAGLDLPAVFAKCYENGGYASLINYALPPDTILNSAETHYIDQLLRSKGLRQ